jgi:hypothetical protein
MTEPTVIVSKLWWDKQVEINTALKAHVRGLEAEQKQIIINLALQAKVRELEAELKELEANLEGPINLEHSDISGKESLAFYEKSSSVNK